MSLKFLLERRSVVAAQLREPGPTEDEIRDLVRAAVRVPDHKALAPWRFLIFTGDARQRIGEQTAKIFARKNNEDCRDRQIEAERNKFLRAPVVITVISSPKESSTVPEVEQLLSAGAAAQNILHGAKALGYASQWVTEWLAYDEEVHKLLGLSQQETIAGFIYIGTPQQAPKERGRVEPEQVMTYWKGV